jgi:hypothetical protein
MTNLIKVGAIAALATVGVIFGNVTASALETTPPAAPKITVSTAQYKGEKNTIKFEGTANDHYRFVITSGANKIQLNSAIRQELMQGSELSVEELVKKYYPDFANSIYDTPISIDIYWFDKEGNYDNSLHQTVALTVGGNLTKAVKLNQISAILKNPESLPEALVAPNPATPENPVNPEASTESENVNIATTPALVESTPASVSSPRKETKPAETLAETGVSVYSVIAAAVTVITAGGAAIIKRS